MTRNSDPIGQWRSFVASKHAYEDDARLVSQVQVWEITSRIQETFGTNVELPPLLPELCPQIRRFVIELDSCRADWSERFAENAHIGNYPKKGVGLHHHFAKLYLCSHIFRGRSSIVCGVEWEMDEIVHIAIISASSILTSLVSDQELQSYLDGLPSYFFTMITFAAVFLLKVASRYPNMSCVPKGDHLDLVRRVVATLQQVSLGMHQRHLLVSIAHGLHEILLRLETDTRLRGQDSVETLSEAPITHAMTRADVPWLSNLSDISLWDHCDFLSTQTPSAGVDFNLDFQPGI